MGASHESAHSPPASTMASNSSSTATPLAGSQGGKGRLSKSFLGLLLSQLLGATNDNILRWLVIGGV